MSDPSQIPASDDLREARLFEIRRQAESKGRLEVVGIRPAGAPFPVASPETGYYGLPLLKRPHGPGRFLCISSPAGLRDRLPSSAQWRAGSVAIAVWHATAVISQLSVQRPPRRC